jgi:2-amino-4-hydroxy-6-hydroxymethyldihydropteridine diphosphokinase
VTAYVGIGSNIRSDGGDPACACRDAADALDGLPRTRLVALSPLYETEPVDGAGPAWFVNAVAAVETGLTPEALLGELQRLEHAAGRPAERARGTDRTLDLDLLLYGDLVRPAPDPILPHPRMHARRFVLAPLCDVAPDVVHAAMGRTAQALLAALGPGPVVRRLPTAPAQTGRGMDDVPAQAGRGGR